MVNWERHVGGGLAAGQFYLIRDDQQLGPRNCMKLLGLEKNWGKPMASG